MPGANPLTDYSSVMKEKDVPSLRAAQEIIRPGMRLNVTSFAGESFDSREVHTIHSEAGEVRRIRVTIAPTPYFTKRVREAK
ncbi:hypothetical protein MRBLMI12_004410 [Microbacterium sp. LMI12-1-1.1]|uniref:hypothetical protein n=1 Tax=Microbacterium sp. LMI12-1-1.1 TaxID=3135225 RepID=UPI003420B856